MTDTLTSSPALEPTSAELPSWVHELVRIGSSFAKLNQNNRTDFLVLLVPVRAFAAVFLAAGMVLKDLLTCIHSVEDHFQWLCSLPPGTVLNNEHRQGTIVEVDGTTDPPRLKLAIGHGNSRTTFSTFVCHPSMENWLPKNSLRPESGSLPDRLASHLVDGSAKWFISVEADPTVVICGERKTLFEEINASLVNIENESDELCLEELLLANEYPYQNELRRTRIESRRQKSQKMADPTEHLVIYDGGRAFLNRSQDFQGTNQILLMEFGDSDLPEALERVDGMWLDRIEDDRSEAQLPTPPPGCEMAHFQMLT